MSAYYNLGKAAFKTPVGKKIVEKVTSFFKPKSKVSPDIKSVKPGKNLTKKRKHQDDVIKTRDKIIKEYGITDPKVKTDLRTKANQPKINKKIADIQDRDRVKKMGGGMMGRRMGYATGTQKKNFSKLPEDVQKQINKKLAEEV